MKKTYWIKMYWIMQKKKYNETKGCVYNNK